MSEEAPKRKPRKYERRKYKITPRDNDIITRLYFAPFQSTEQLRRKAKLHQLAPTEEESTDAITRRLYRLAEKGKVENHVSECGVVIWKLTKEGWQREVDDLMRYTESFRKSFPNEDRIPHYVETNDVFDAAAPRLDAILGKHPAWEWVHERKCYQKYRTPDGPKYHRPDAEIYFGDWLFFIERQTERSRKTKGAFDKRCGDYRSYIDHLGRSDSNTVLVFVCDTNRDIEYARQAANRHGVTHIEAPLQQCVNRIVNTASELAQQENNE